ncbi:EamA-like transporter family protein [Vibrio quintilis]|uniref:EamA-like transporter family protein n=2 Tax=Vibrio quintilis TaxID=1117707 RepID=A0A1M7YT33_9VIBR|nr:EamA-like transporter family protein [Vibrio quintilis]
MGCTFIILSVMAIVNGGWSTIQVHDLLPMALSGFIGIFIGDTALFACFNRMGPRQAGLLFSCHAVFSAILGFFIFGETMTITELSGSLLVFGGVVIAIFFKKSNPGELETIHGNIWAGILLGLLAALCQALGGILAKPVMQSGTDPVAASAVRMIAAFAAHGVLFLTGTRIARPTLPITLRIFWITLLNGFLAMAVGMTLIMYALQKGNVGMVALLSSTTPIILLPVLWLYTKQRPNRFAWFGAMIAVIGTAMLVY